MDIAAVMDDDINVRREVSSTKKYVRTLPKGGTLPFGWDEDVLSDPTSQSIPGPFKEFTPSGNDLSLPRANKETPAQTEQRILREQQYLKEQQGVSQQGVSQRGVSQQGVSQQGAIPKQTAIEAALLTESELRQKERREDKDRENKLKEQQLEIERVELRKQEQAFALAKKQAAELWELEKKKERVHKNATERDERNEESDDSGAKIKELEMEIQRLKSRSQPEDSEPEDYEENGGRRKTRTGKKDANDSKESGETKWEKTLRKLCADISNKNNKRVDTSQDDTAKHLADVQRQLQKVAKQVDTLSYIPVNPLLKAVSINYNDNFKNRRIASRADGYAPYTTSFFSCRNDFITMCRRSPNARSDTIYAHVTDDSLPKLFSKVGYLMDKHAQETLPSAYPFVQNLAYVNVNNVYLINGDGEQC